MRLAVPILLLTACAPICTGTSIGTDLVLTAKHCAEPSIRLVRARIQRPDVAMGDRLTIVAAVGCGPISTGSVIEMRGDVVVLDTRACPGNSGAPAFDSGGRLVGVVVRMRWPSGRAVVELL